MMETNKVEIRLLTNGSEITNETYSTCSFCHKKEWVNIKDFKRNAKIAHGKYHCTFCIRNCHHHRDSRNILPLNFLGIIGFYYHHLYCSKPRIMWLNQIANYIEKHQEIGLENPVFNYDQATGNWFINFNKVEKGKCCTTLNEVYDTVKKIIYSFDFESIPINQHTQGCQSVGWATKFIQIYTNAIYLFYSQRKKDAKNILSPNPLPKIDQKPFSLSVIIDSSPTQRLPNTILADSEIINDICLWSIKKIQVEIKQKKMNGIEGFEGTVCLPGTKPTKIAKEDGSTFFATIPRLKLVANSFAQRLSCDVEFIELSQKTKESRKNTKGD